MNHEKVQKDVRENKIKQGLVLKQSRHLKQWKQRWMVLTRTHLYTFPDKTQYKNPTQTIMLKDVVTLKSYYKDQYKPFTFRVESQQVSLHMCTKNSDEKWAWMTAIQKMIQRVLYPYEKKDSQNQIKQTLRMSTVARQTMMIKQQKNKENADFSNDLLKKMKLNIQTETHQVQILPETIVRNNFVSKQEQTFFVVKKKQSLQDSPGKKTEQNKNPAPEENLFLLEQTTPQNKSLEKVSSGQTKQINNNVEIKVQIKQRIVQKIVQVPVQRIVQKIIQRIVKVPEIKQKIIQKIIYKQNPVSKNSEGISQVLKCLMMTPTQNPTPLVNFVVYLLTANLEKYQSQILQFCMDTETRRFFAQIFLLMLNQETNQQSLKRYLQFILILYENSDEYFYSSDTKVLISILIRQMQMNRSQFHQHLVMLILQAMVNKSWWADLNYRKAQIKAFIKQIEAISRQQNQFLAANLLEKL